MRTIQYFGLLNTEGSKTLVSALSQNKAEASLQLDNCVFDPDSTTRIAQALCRNNFVTEIKLTNVEFQGGINQIISAMGTMRKLTSFELDCSKYSYAITGILFQLQDTCNSVPLSKIILSNINISPGCIDALTTIKPLVPNLQIENPTIKDSEKDAFYAIFPELNYEESVAQTSSETPASVSAASDVEYLGGGAQTPEDL